MARRKGYKGCCYLCSANKKWKGSGAEHVPFKVKRMMGKKRRLNKRAGSLGALLDDLAAEFGPPTEADLAWADKALGRNRRATA